ncbi:outer membrane beta-barrel protein [Alteromonas stellipolaris]|uniref:outer membrane beta-barrel protein n=1 Tax=Alteromonas stellipolaris TaxID=233316 RepID=UPI0021179DEB|nr:outer membrane beta-barrel protein [Alteromonas stellipolaris]MCQ8847340.1 outer membrane beta-barrel protein [Alteromonas stellipolaris]
MNKQYTKLSLPLLALSVLAFSGRSHAQESLGYKLDNGAIISPSVYFGTGYEQNLALTNDNEINSAFWQFTSSVLMTLAPGKASHELTLSSDIARYTSSSADDYEDILIGYAGEWEPTSRHRTNWTLNQNFGHQKRGSQQTRFELDRFDEVLQFSSTDALASYEFGSLVARGRLGLSVGYGTLNYDNFTDFTSQFERDTYDVAAWFYYRPAQVTNISFDIMQQTISYKNDVVAEPSRDARVLTFLVGAIWEGLAKTTGEFKIGIENREYDEPGRDEQSNLAIDAEVVWTPKTYSLVTLSATQSTQEGVAGSDATLTTVVSANWGHSWSEYTITQLGYEFQKRDEQGLARKDTQHYMFTSYQRLLNPWLSLNAQIKWLVNSSNVALYDYDNQQFTIGLKVEI